MYRFVTGWDVNRWELTNEKLHEEAVKNLASMPWPRELMGASFKGDGRIIIVDTEDNLASSRLLHPDLHKLFSGPLGSPFWAGIPSRNTLVLFSNRKELKQRIGRRLKKDYAATRVSDHRFAIPGDARRHRAVFEEVSLAAAILTAAPPTCKICHAASEIHKSLCG